jgi:hypothetical protein
VGQFREVRVAKHEILEEALAVWIGKLNDNMIQQQMGLLMKGRR